MKTDIKNHSFNVAVAKDVGILPAIILNNIYFWVDYNEKNGTNYYEDHYWSYNSVTAFQRQFSYATQKQIRTALEKLRDEGYILTANYNKAPFDRTLWYTVTDKAISIIGGENTSNYIPPVENTSTEVQESVKEKKYTDEIKEIIDYLNNKIGSKYRYNTESNNKLIRARLNEGFTVDNFKQVIDIKYDEWIKKPEMVQYLRPLTLFGNKFEQYLNQKTYRNPHSQITSRQATQEDLEYMRNAKKY